MHTGYDTDDVQIPQLRLPVTSEARANATELGVRKAHLSTASIDPKRHPHLYLHWLRLLKSRTIEQDRILARLLNEQQPPSQFPRIHKADLS
jgi:hypothetical protein